VEEKEKIEISNFGINCLLVGSGWMRGGGLEGVTNFPKGEFSSNIFRWQLPKSEISQG